MFDVKRSATVMTKNFGSVGEIDDETVKKLMFEHPEVKQYFWNYIMNNYDDDLTIFL